MLTFPLAGVAQDIDSIKTMELMEVVITSTDEGDTLQNFYRANPASTTETVLSRMTGVSLIRRGAYGQEPMLRGLTGGQLNLTLDGMKIFGACTDKMDPATIYVEPMNLAVIQASAGPEGAEFGSTIGGSLNLKMVEPLAGENRVSGVVGTDFQTSAAGITAFSATNISRTKSGYSLNATYRKSGNYHSGGGGTVDHSQFEKANAAVSGKWLAGRRHAFRADFLFDQGWNIGFPALPMDVGSATAAIYSAAYELRGAAGRVEQLKAKLYQNRIYHQMDDTQRENVAMHMDMPGKSITSGAWSEARLQLFSNQPTSLKAEYYHHRLLGEMTMYPPEGVPMYMQTAPDAARKNVGLYLRQPWKIDRNNQVSVALRGDVFHDQLENGIGLQQWQIFDGNISATSSRFLKTFSSAYRRQLGARMNARLTAGYGERMPTLNERYGFYLFNRSDGYDYLGNPELLNETSWSADLNIGYFSDKVEFQLNPFFTSIRHYIMGAIQDELNAMTIGARGVKQHANLDWANMAGTDVMLLASPLPQWQLIGNLKYTHGVTSMHEAIPQIPPLKVVATLRYQVKSFNIQAEQEWAASQNRISASFGEAATPRYYVVHLRSGWQMKNLQLNAGCENLLDNQYREHLDWGGIPRPGRNMYINMVYRY